jgi:hypothetical protein
MRIPVFVWGLKCGMQSCIPTGAIARKPSMAGFPRAQLVSKVAAA